MYGRGSNALYCFLFRGDGLENFHCLVENNDESEEQREA